MKIGILTHYDVNNQGAQLQLYAMRAWLMEHGHDVCILSYTKNFDFDKNEEKKNSGSFLNFKYYIEEYLIKRGLGLTLFNTRKMITHRKLRSSIEMQPYDNNDCDAIIIGSDEVYSIDVGCNKMMYGNGLQGKPAIAYAPAFGRTTIDLLKQYDCYEIVKTGLDSMYALSARDTHTQEMIKEITGKDVLLVCDPVLLYSGKGFVSNASTIRKDYMIMYSYDANMNDEHEIKAIQEYARKHKLITVSLCTYHKWCDRNIVCNAIDWYGYFRNAKCVVTDTFHGTVVAMKNHCNVAVYIRKSINSFKMQSLLDSTGTLDRLLDKINIESLEQVLGKQINYETVDRNIRNMAEDSEQYLLKALGGIHE